MKTRKKTKNGHVKILIVEDSPTQAEELKYLLEKHNYTVLTASDGKKALALLKQHRPAVIVSDIVMPEMDGYQFCRHVKMNEELKNIPVILLTALSGPEDVIKGLECGADNFITKPYNEEYLTTRIQYLLAKERLHEQDDSQVGLTIHFGKKKYFISSNRLQIFNLFLSTYETAVYKNIELTKAQDEMRELNKHLEDKVRERTAELTAEVQERKRTQEQIVRLNTVLHALRNVNQLITKENDRGKLLEGACDNLTKTRGYSSAWIALFDDAGKLLFTTESGLGKAFLPMLKRLQRGELTECGHRAMGQPGLLIIRDASNECADCPLATKHDKKIVIAAQLEYGTKTCGILAVSLPSDFPLDMEEQSLFQELVDDIAFGLYKIEMEERSKQAEHALQKRYKELNCLYNISSLTALPGISLDELLNRIVTLIPQAWRFSEITEACIVLEGKAFKTARFHETSWMQASNIIVDGKTVGQVELCYLEERQASDEGPFLKEERLLLNAIAERLGNLITRMRAREALRESEEKYHTLFETSVDGILIADLETRQFLYANPSICRMLGYTEEELRTMGVATIHPKEDLQRVGAEFEAQARGDKTLAMDIPCLKKDGTIVYADINTVKITIDGRNCNVGSFRDTTERKQVEQQALVTAKLASVGELVAGVAHEINNPLTGVIGYAQLLADRQDVPQSVKEDLQKIYEESQRTVKIVQNLLRFARQYKPEKSLVDINELIERTLELEAYKLRTSNVGLSTKLATDIPLILADYNQLQQVLLNIMSNAQQAMAETKRKGKIMVTTGVIEDYVRISVADNGPGISPDNVTKIFDPFFTTKPVGSGSGLGLSVCHGIITEHSGNIYAESTPGKGTIFIIELPIATGEPAVIKEEPVKKKGQRPRRGVIGKILIVEDEPAIRTVLTRNLSAMGYQVNAISDGKDALSKLTNNVYKLLLLDLKMPGMSGRELYEVMKEKHPNSANRIVFITGDVMTADTHDFLVSTGRSYLIKPFDSKDIADVIEKVLVGDNGQTIS